MPVPTLNLLSQLRDSGFGQPAPRHGLHLLFWFAKDFVKFRGSEMVVSEHPVKGSYGFHRFYNIKDDENTKLLPHQFTYYEVGNLNEKMASDLPYYVRQQHTRRPDNSNTNRLIVSIDYNGYIHRVYVTEHSDPTHFSTRGTYCISQGLINSIRGLDLNGFLNQMQERNTSSLQSSFNHDVGLHYTQQTYRHTSAPSHTYTHTYSHTPSYQNSDDSCAWVCCVALIALVVVGGIVLLLTLANTEARWSGRV